MVRAYGKKSEVIIDRKQEIMVRKAEPTATSNHHNVQCAKPQLAKQNHRAFFYAKSGHKPTKTRAHHKQENNKRLSISGHRHESTGGVCVRVCVLTHWDKKDAKENSSRPSSRGIGLTKERGKPLFFGERRHRHTEIPLTRVEPPNCHRQRASQGWRVHQKKGQGMRLVRRLFFIIFLGLCTRTM